eukprot:GEMP01061034.1.p1 GENE.GEMP01061034.1~~GEMP01061034.1.p1  ORF type:complete len:292 (+),score=77.03 GEMP01061034.1:169-1044(+)
MTWFCLISWLTLVPGRLLQPQVDQLHHDVMEAQAKAKVATLRARTQAAEARQREGAAEARALRFRADKMKFNTEAQTESLQETLDRAKAESAAAAVSSKQASSTFEMLKKSAEQDIDDADTLAREEVRVKLKELYKQLNGWRHKVLRNPYKEAQEAGVLAAEPYHKMIRTFNERIHEYQLSAQTLVGKANGLSSGSQDLAVQAQSKQSSGDAIGANQDLMTAQSMMVHAEQLSNSANALQGQATSMNKLIGQYLAAAHLAAWTAMYKVNPDGLPPPPNDWSAFLPPKFEVA